MAAVLLPTCPLPNEAQPFLVDAGGYLTPFLGGPVQRINRLGMRFGVRFVMPELDGEEARAYVARLLRGRADRVVIPWPQTIYSDDDPGNASMLGNVAGGTAISVKGLNPSYAFAEGQFFSVIHGGRRYVYMTTSTAQVGIGGTAALSIWPPLRTPLSVNDVVEVAEPMIEGLVSPGDELVWQQAIDLTSVIEFSVVEGR